MNSLIFSNYFILVSIIVDSKPNQGYNSLLQGTMHALIYMFGVAKPPTGFFPKRIQRTLHKTCTDTSRGYYLNSKLRIKLGSMPLYGSKMNSKNISYLLHIGWLPVAAVEIWHHWSHRVKRDKHFGQQWWLK